MGSPINSQASDKPKSSLTAFQKILWGLAPLVFIIGGTLWLFPGAQEEIDYAEMVYGVTIAEAPSSVLNRGIIVIDRDGNRLQCQLPSKNDIKESSPMKCTDPHREPILIKARRPV